MLIIPENIYGHSKRLNWIVSHLRKTDRIVEIGCGTGVMITAPLARMDYEIIGLDIDEKSIRFGQELLKKQGLNPNILMVADIGTVDVNPDVIIVSEVIEHLSDQEISGMMEMVHQRLKPHGRLLITAPNGYGWFELESWLWFRARLGRWIERLRFDTLIRRMKQMVFRNILEEFTPSTLSTTSHLQRFTYQSIRRLIEHHGFEITDDTGSVLFAGPFSNLFLSGIESSMKWNCIIGETFPRLAAGFYIACKLP